MDPPEEPVAGKTKVRKRYDIPKTAKCHVCGRFNNIFTLLQFSLAYRVTRKKVCRIEVPAIRKKGESRGINNFLLFQSFCHFIKYEIIPFPSWYK